MINFIFDTIYRCIKEFKVFKLIFNLNAFFTYNKFMINVEQLQKYLFLIRL